LKAGEAADELKCHCCICWVVRMGVEKKKNRWKRLMKEGGKIEKQRKAAEARCWLSELDDCVRLCSRDCEMREGRRTTIVNNPKGYPAAPEEN